MEIMKSIAKRNSVRAYKKDQISKEQLDIILTAASAAPIAMKHYESMHLTIIQNQEIIAQMSNIIKEAMKTANEPFYGAPTLVLISSTEPQTPGIDYSNAGCIAENMMLAAAAEGVGSVIVWASGMAVELNHELKKSLSIPEGFTSLFGVALGYATSEQPEKNLDFIINMNYL